MYSVHQLKEKAVELEAKKAAAGNGSGPASSRTRSSQKVGTADYATRRRELLQKRMQQRNVPGQDTTEDTAAPGEPEPAAEAENS